MCIVYVYMYNYRCLFEDSLQYDNYDSEDEGEDEDEDEGDDNNDDVNEVENDDED